VFTSAALDIAARYCGLGVCSFAGFLRANLPRCWIPLRAFFCPMLGGFCPMLGGFVCASLLSAPPNPARTWVHKMGPTAGCAFDPMIRAGIVECLFGQRRRSRTAHGRANENECSHVRERTRPSGPPFRLRATFLCQPTNFSTKFPERAATVSRYVESWV
jgi:hypothetical protein